MTGEPPFDANNLIAALFNDDDQLAVLRGQLYIENALEQLLAIETQAASRPLFEFMDFSRKIDAGKSLGILNGHDTQALYRVASMRNQFAHRLDRVLTVEDDEKVLKDLRGPYKELYDMLFDAWRGNQRLKKPGFPVRLAFVTIYRRLAERDPFQIQIREAIAGLEQRRASSRAASEKRRR